MPALTKLDDQLVQFISRGLSAKEISQTLKRPLSFVYYRIERLKHMGIVETKGYTINYRNLGYNINAVMVAKIGGPLYSKVLKYISPADAVLAEQIPGMVIQYAGSAENGTIIVIKAMFKGIKEIDDFVKKLQGLYQIQSLTKYLMAEERTV